MLRGISEPAVMFLKENPVKSGTLIKESSSFFMSEKAFDVLIQVFLSVF